MSDKIWDELDDCRDISGESQCTDDSNAPRMCGDFELEEEGNLCKHCWIQDSKGHCELHPTDEPMPKVAE